MLALKITVLLGLYVIQSCLFVLFGSAAVEEVQTNRRVGAVGYLLAAVFCSIVSAMFSVLVL